MLATDKGKPQKPSSAVRPPFSAKAKKQSFVVRPPSFAKNKNKRKGRHPFDSLRSLRAGPFDGFGKLTAGKLRAGLGARF